MSNTLTVHLRGMSGTVDLELPEGASVADARDAGDVGDNVAFAQGGQRIERDQEGSTPVTDGQTLTSLPPEVKAG